MAPDTDPPTVTDDNGSTDEDTPVPITVLGNDTDPDDDIDPATVSITEEPAHGAVAVDPQSGLVTYTPVGDYSGADSFTYEVCDGAGNCDTATVTLSVAGAPDPPGAVTYTPNAGFSGDDSFTYRVCDQGGECDTARVFIRVVPAAATQTGAPDTPTPVPTGPPPESLAGHIATTTPGQSLVTPAPAATLPVTGTGSDRTVVLALGLLGVGGLLTAVSRWGRRSEA